MSNDVLNSLANLSNDEVFTSAKVANKMLDLLPNKFWNNKNAKVLNPFMKSGIFLREIVLRFDVGLSDVIKDKDERIGYILKNIIYGMPITKMTSLLSKRTVYTSRHANGEYSLGADIFEDSDGNIKYVKTEHVFRKGKCVICGITKGAYGDDFENYAYPFIHRNKTWEEMTKMKFDLIIGNPPYQLKDGEGGGGSSAKPIYQLFVHEAMKMNPDHLLMVIPSRWFGAGKGLDKFRGEMLNNDSIKEIHDFENEKILFPSISLKGGVNFFYMEKGYQGSKKFYKYSSLNDSEVFTLDSLETKINGKSTGILSRNMFATTIFNKVWDKKRESLEATISSSKPFGLRSNELGSRKQVNEDDFLLHGKGRSKTFIDSKDKRLKNLDKAKYFKVGLPKAVGNALITDKAPNTIIANPGELLSETYVMKTFDNMEQAESFVSYVQTDIFRFLFNSMRYSHNVTKSSYRWIPNLQWNKEYTNEILVKEFGITKDEYNEILKQLGESNA